MKALILAAGLGTRLRPLTETIPKPLVPIAGKPLLEYHLDHLNHHGITEVLINTHYLADKIDSFLIDYKERTENNLIITTVFEPELLGSAGTLKKNQSFFNDCTDFLIVYSDNLTDINYTKLLEQHKKKQGIATIASYYEHFPEQKGIIEYDSNSKGIIKFIEKPKSEEITSHYANAGLYVLNNKIFDLIADLDHELLDFGHHVFPTLLQKDQPMYVYTMEETLLDIGNHENYTKAQALPNEMNF